MEQDNRNPQPGDLIEIDGTLHQHWALYMGDGYVINLFPVGKQEVEQEGLKVTVLIRTVKKELLVNVAGKNQWRVNNKSDKQHNPLPVEKIISHAKAYIGKEVTYRSFGSNCERFVKNLRYGEAVAEQFRAFEGDEIHRRDPINRNYLPIPGDLIEIFLGHYEHWAIYVGCGYVIHVTDLDEGAPSLSGSSDTRHMRRAKVKKELLREVVGNDKSCVINKYDSDHPPLPVDEIIWHAEGCVGMELTYDVSKFKSVDFLSKLRHVGLFRAFEGCEIHHRDQISRNYLPIPGDLIEISLGHYKHWALYVGRGYVIHVTDLDEGAPSLSGSSDTRHMRRAKVKKELLREVARKKKWSVSNEYDCHLAPLPVDEIIWHAEGCVGIDLIYDVSKFKSVDILRKLRHVGLFRAFEGGEIHCRDPINHKYLPIPGDLIEISSEHYDQWAIYVGRGYVIHVTDLDEGAPSLSGSSDTRHMRRAKVKKELLREVARKKKWRVSNEYDCHLPPLPMDEIIWHAESYVGKEFTYDVSKFKSVDFLSKLRHVGLFRAFEGGEIHCHDLINRKYLPIPGDLIEIERGDFDHWAIYVGRGYVIHVTGLDRTGASSGSVSSGFGQVVVKKKLLEKVVRKNKWCVNNKYDNYWKPFPVKEIIQRAEGWVGEKVPYCCFWNNCEHFVTKLRYGVGLSDQVKYGAVRLLRAAKDYFCKQYC